MNARGAAPSAAAFALALTIACGRTPRDAGDLVVATVDAAAITRSELERYLALNVVALDGESESPVEEVAAVKSRLLDALIDERLLLAEAARRGIDVTDAQVAPHLAAEDEDAPNGRPAPDSGDQVRQRLILEQLQEELLSQLPPIDADEIRAFQNRSGEADPESRPLRLRALILPSADDAARVRREVRAGRITFDQAVERYRTEPGHGLPLPVEWDSLAKAVRDALRDLAPGQVSRPVVLDGTAYLFVIESWKAEPSPTPGGQRAEALRELRERRRRGTLDALLTELRANARIHIHERRLPFRYVEDE